MRKNNFSFAVSTGAFNDANEIALWYNEKMEGLGFRFLTKLKTSFDKIHSFPENFSRYQKSSDIRKYVVSGFPYRIYYLFRKDHIEVLAIVHTSRSNQFIKRKLQ
jgi:plasmid stabilization system protein ParE